MCNWKIRSTTKPTNSGFVKNKKKQRKQKSGSDIKTLQRENYRLRQERRELRAQLEKGGGGSAISAYQELGTVDEIRAQLARLDELQGELATRDRQETIRQAAELAGYKPSVLTDLAEARGLTIEIREVGRGGGATASLPYVITGEGENARATPLTNFTESHLSEYLPALRQRGDQSSRAGRWIPQKPGARGRPAKSGSAAGAVLSRYVPTVNEG